MSIKQTDGSIIINHLTPITVTPQSRDDGKGIEVFEFPDSTLQAGHLFVKRDLGRTLSSDGLATQKGKVSTVVEKITVAGKRRTLSQSVNLTASSDFTQAETEASIADLAQFLLDNKVDLAAGRFGS